MYGGTLVDRVPFIWWLKDHNRLAPLQLLCLEHMCTFNLYRPCLHRAKYISNQQMCERLQAFSISLLWPGLQLRPSKALSIPLWPPRASNTTPVASWWLQGLPSYAWDLWPPGVVQNPNVWWSLGRCQHRRMHLVYKGEQVFEYPFRVETTLVCRVIQRITHSGEAFIEASFKFKRLIGASWSDLGPMLKNQVLMRRKPVKTSVAVDNP